MANLDLLSLLSDHPIDKIVQSDTISIPHPGAIGVNTPGSFGVTNMPSNRRVTHSVPNEYGRAGFIRAVYSFDNGDTWQNVLNEVRFQWQIDNRTDGVFDFYTYEAGLRSRVAVGCSDSTIYFEVINNYLSGATIANFSTATTITTFSGWSAVAQTLLVKYWLYERV